MPLEHTCSTPAAQGLSPLACWQAHSRSSAAQRLAIERAAAARRHAAAASASSKAATAWAVAARPCQRQQQRRRCSGAAGVVASAAQQQAAGSEEEARAITSAALAGLRYTTPDGCFVVRPLDKGNAREVRRVVALQTDAFHTPPPLALLDGMTKKFFEAEVLSEMQKKLKFNPDDLFCSLVIEPTPAAASSKAAAAVAASDNGSTSSAGKENLGTGSESPGVVGVVEISYVSTRETLVKLEPGTEGFCYVASMVVAPGWRRRGAAQALLHVYQDNEPAVQLYRRAGYEVLHAQNKLWAAVGSRPRYLMRKCW